MIAVYILSNWNNQVLYVGVTANLEKRIHQHKTKEIDGFTKKYNLTKLLYFQPFQSIREAIQTEKRIKGWSRKKKLDLILSLNPEMKDLAETH